MQHRQNDAQDEQISIRGFGARATFGALGVKGALRRDERNRVEGADQYIQLDCASPRAGHGWPAYATARCVSNPMIATSPPPTRMIWEK